MLTCLVLVSLFIQSFGQTIDCSIGVGYNSSFIGITSVPTLDGFPYPYGFYPSLYSNGSYVVYQQLWQNNSYYNAFYGSATYNYSRSNNSNGTDCYMDLKWQSGPLIGQTSCYAYSVIMNPASTIGCFNYSSSTCPTSCTPQYVLGNNHSWFGSFYFNALSDTKNLITDRKFEQAINCDAVVGYNMSTIFYNTSYPQIQYSSIYSNGTFIGYYYNGSYRGTAKYNISRSTTTDFDCQMFVQWEPLDLTMCMAYSLTMNGINGGVGCTAFSSSCPSSCTTQYVLANGHSWTTHFFLNPL